MSDEKDSVGPLPFGAVHLDEAEPDETGPGLGVENPLLAFVKDGTTTWENDRKIEQDWHEAEHRRDVAAKERALAGVPIDDGGAVQHVHKLTDNPEIPKAYIHLKYLNRHGGFSGLECMADLIVGIGENPTELMLILVCPKCVHERRLHHDQAQIQIRQSNRNFQFVAGMGPATFMFDGMQYNSAGTITESERFTCPNCSWTARISNNFVRSE